MKSPMKAILDVAGLPMKWSRGRRYVGGFIGLPRMQERWIHPMVSKWVGGVEKLAKVDQRYPQAAYAGWSTASRQNGNTSAGSNLVWGHT